MAGEKRARGFAAMDAAKQREIASKGGRAAHQKGTAHEFTSEEAAAAGRKGGRAAHQKGTAHEFTPEEASAAGRKGGHAAHRNRGQQATMAPQTAEPQGQSGFSAPDANLTSPNPNQVECPVEGRGSPEGGNGQAEHRPTETVAQQGQAAV